MVGDRAVDITAAHRNGLSAGRDVGSRPARGARARTAALSAERAGATADLGRQRDGGL